MPFDIRECSYFEAAKEKFLAKVNKTDTCWLWTTEKTGKLQGYGYFKIDGHDYRAHRLSYMFFKGPIPYDKIVRHTCDIKACVNPDHLILGTPSENTIDGLKRNRSIGAQKLNTEAVKVIKWYLKYRPESGLAAKLARLHGVHQNTIAHIKWGRTWHWIEV